jgi:hypothetical protein
MNGLCYMPLLLGVLNQAPTPAGDTAADLKARLEFMKESMATHEIHALDDRGTRFRLQPDPVLRFTNPVGGSRDGALFLWLDEAGRPVVASQILWNPQQIWAQEFSSLSPSPLIARSPDGRVWNPSRGGVSFQPVPEAARPADTDERRLRQMRQLADGFSAEHNYRGRTWNQLRLLTKPFARYGKPGSEVQDGALFCFAQGTDPEALLMLESRLGRDGPEWQYAFAPMTGFAINASWKGKPIWTKPAEGNGSARNPSNTFHIRRVVVEEVEDSRVPTNVKP